MASLEKELDYRDSIRDELCMQLRQGGATLENKLDALFDHELEMGTWNVLESLVIAALENQDYENE